MLTLHDRGSVLVADLALSAAIVIAIGSIASAFGILAGHQQDQREAARYAAVVAARSGDTSSAYFEASRIAEDAAITIGATAGSVTVTVSSHQAVPHPVLRRVTIEVSAGVTVPIAPYRSGR